MLVWPTACCSAPLTTLTWCPWQGPTACCLHQPHALQPCRPGLTHNGAALLAPDVLQQYQQVHVHLVDFFVLQRGNNDTLLTPLELNSPANGLFAFERHTPKDVVYLGPSQTIWLLARCAYVCWVVAAKLALKCASYHGDAGQAQSSIVSIASCLAEPAGCCLAGLAHIAGTTCSTGKFNHCNCRTAARA